jgi:KUP system potassium uptake protein
MLPLLLPLALIDVAFFVANAQKIPAGGWFPLAFGGLVFLVMRTWKTGREIVTRQLLRQERTVEAFQADIERNPPIRIPGTAVFLTSQTEGVPRTLARNIKFNGVMHEQAIIVSVSTDRIPRVPLGAKVKVRPVAPGLWRVFIKVGFVETAHVPQLLREAERQGLSVATDRATYFLGREQVVADSPRGMSKWRKRMFLFMARNAEFAGESFSLPKGRIVEMGGHVTI